MPSKAVKAMTAPKRDQGEMNNLSSSPLSSISEPDLSFTPPKPIPSIKNQLKSSPLKNGGDKEMPERPKKKPTKRTPKKSKWDAENILTDPKSPLATADLRVISSQPPPHSYMMADLNKQRILSNPMAWSVLDKDERIEILSLFPDKEHILDAETEDARPNFVSLLNDDSFRYDCAAYTEHIAQGRYDPEWLASAWGAHERRKAGDFDEYLTTKLQEAWEVELPEEMKVHRKQLEKTVTENREKSHESGGSKNEDAMQIDGSQKDEDTPAKEVDEMKMDVDDSEARD